MQHRVLCFGDSNTYGYDPRSCLGGRYPESVRWTGLLKARGWEIINEGENGRAIPRLGREMEAAVQTVCRSGAEALAVMLGSNDLLQRPGLISAETCARWMEAFLSAIEDAAPAGLKVLLIAPPPMELGGWVPDDRLIKESRRLAGCYGELARRMGVGFADAGSK